MKNIVILLFLFLIINVYASGLNYNNTNRKADVLATGVTNIYSASDFPDTLTTGVYKLKASVTKDSICIAAGASVRIISDGPDKVLTLTGTGAVIGDGGSTPGLFTMTGFDVALTGDSATLFNLNGVLYDANRVNFLFDDSTGQSIGNIINSPFSISISECVFNGFENGLTVDTTVDRVFFINSNFISDNKGTGDLLTFGPSIPRIEVKGLDIHLATGETIFNIDSALTGTMLIKDIYNSGAAIEYNPAGLDRTNVLITNDLSKNIGSTVMHTNDSATHTDIQNTWYDFNFNEEHIKTGSNIEQWTLVNDTIGLLRCNALSGLDGTMFGSFSVVSTGGTQVFEMRMLVNDTVPADSVISSRSVASLVGNMSYTSPLKVLVGDSVKLQVRNVDGTSTFTVINGSITIQ